MNVSKKIMSFRKARAHELESFLGSIESVIGGHTGDFRKIHQEISNLKKKDTGFHSIGKTDYQCWGYKLSDCHINLTEGQKHMTPKSVVDVEMIIDADVLCDCMDWDKTNDPFQRLNFRVRLKGIDHSIGKECYSGFHLDKDIDDEFDKEIHPKYHLHFDPLPHPLRKSAENGPVLILDTPRFPHVPLDLVTGLDFLFSSFMPKAWSKLRNDGLYCNILKKYQKSFWDPYFKILQPNISPRKNQGFWSLQNVFPHYLH